MGREIFSALGEPKCWAGFRDKRSVRYFTLSRLHQQEVKDILREQETCMTAVAKYGELGLVNTKAMFTKAMEGRYAVPAYNFNNMEQLQAILMGCSESRSPVILQCSGSAIRYMNSTLLKLMVKGAVEDDDGSRWLRAGGPPPRPWGHRRALSGVY